MTCFVIQGRGMNMARGVFFPTLTSRAIFFPNGHFFFFIRRCIHDRSGRLAETFRPGSAMSATGYRVVTYLLMSLAVMTVIRAKLCVGLARLVGHPRSDGRIPGRRGAAGIDGGGHSLVRFSRSSNAKPAARCRSLSPACCLFLLSTTAPRNALYDAALILVAAYGGCGAKPSGQ